MRTFIVSSLEPKEKLKKIRERYLGSKNKPKYELEVFGRKVKLTAEEYHKLTLEWQ